MEEKNYKNIIVNRRKKFTYTKEEKKVATFKEAKPYLKYFKGFRFQMFAILALIIIFSAISVFEPIYTSKAVALFAGDLNSNKNLIIKYLIFVLVLKIISIIIKLAQDRIWAYTTGNISLLLRHDILNKLSAITLSCYENEGSATFTTRIFFELNVLAQNPIEMMEIILSIITEIATLIYIAFINIWIAIMALVYSISIGFITKLKEIGQQKRSIIMRKNNQQALNSINEHIAGIRDLRAINSEQELTNKEITLYKDRVGYTLESNVITNRWLFATRSFTAIIFIAFMSLCLYLMLNSQFELATFLVIYGLRSRITSLGSNIITFKELETEFCLSAKRTNEILNNNFPEEEFGTKDIKNFKGQIEFKNVEFSYNKNRKVLNNVSFKIEPNSFVSIVGESGSGKTTLGALIAKLYTIKQGQILIDDEDINNLTRDAIRNNISIINQNPYIFNKTVAENLLIAKPDATKEELISALKQANIYDFIKSLPKEMDSMLGENGIKISGGQKQRIAIARTLLKNSKVIIFDEATSSLDNISQNDIKKTIKALSQNHTIIMIAHRLSTVIDSDKIIFLSNGEVIAEGKHEELMKNCEQYKNLYKNE